MTRDELLQFHLESTKRMYDIASLLAPGAGAAAAVKDESIEDTLLDLANYCILLAAYRKEKQCAQP